MALNQETPYVGDQAVRDMVGVESPNVLRAVTPPERPEPDSAVVVVAPPALRTIAEPEGEPQ